jgi:serine/threonine protein kinase
MISNDDPVKPLSKPLSSMITDVGFCSFLKKLLVLDPTQRISADEALMDPWIIQGFPSELLPEHIKNVKVLK